MPNRLLVLFGSSTFPLKVAYRVVIVLVVLGAVFPAIFLLWKAASFGMTDSGVLSGIWSSWVDERHLSAASNSLILGGTVSAILTIGSCVMCLGIRWSGKGPGVPVYLMCFLPMLVPDYVAGVAGRLLFDPSIGLLGGWFGSSLLIGRTSSAFLSAAIVSAKWLPVMFVVVDTSIRSLGREKLFQTELDYGSYLDAARWVFIPQMKNSLVVVACLGFLLGFRQHQLTYELTSGGAGFVAETWSMWNHKVLFEFGDYPTGAAGAILGLALLLVPIMLVRAYSAGLYRHNV